MAALGCNFQSTLAVANETNQAQQAAKTNWLTKSVRGSVVGVEGGELFFPGEAGGLQESDAAVPAEDGVVVAGGADFFGFAEVF